MRVFLISCYLFVKSIFAGLNFQIFFSTSHLIVLAREHCSEHDPVILSLCLSLFISFSLWSAVPVKVAGWRPKILTVLCP